MTELHEGDCREVLPTLAAGSFASCVCDPPYELDFMGRSWDRTGVAFDPATWAAVLRALKPGAYLAAFGGTRTYHRLTCAIEDAGFEIRDCLMWVYGTGFPKGQGCLKPAWEPVVLARKPGPRVLPLGVDACRVATDEIAKRCEDKPREDRENWRMPKSTTGSGANSPLGRYPANLVHDGSEQVLEAFGTFGEKGGQDRRSVLNRAKRRPGEPGKANKEGRSESVLYSDTGTAARFFYCAKASKAERAGSTHPTMKPLSLMQWLVRLVTPPGGRVLDPFAGSGTTLLAAELEGRDAVGIEQDAKHCEIIRKRLAQAKANDGLFTEMAA